MVTKTERNFFLPRMMSDTVPRIGDSNATMKTEMLRVTDQYWVATAALGNVEPAT